MSETIRHAQALHKAFRAVNAALACATDPDACIELQAMCVIIARQHRVTATRAIEEIAARTDVDDEIERVAEVVRL